MKKSWQSGEQELCQMVEMLRRGRLILKEQPVKFKRFTETESELNHQQECGLENVASPHMR